MPPRRLRARLSEGEMQRGVGMLETGASQRQVATILGVSQSVVSRFWNRYQTTGSVLQRHAGGTQRRTTPREDRYLAMQALRHPFWTAPQLRNDLQDTSGTRLSAQTVRRRLHEANLRSRSAAVRVPLTNQHRQARLAWARQHVTWILAQWIPVLFTDESRFCMDFLDRRRRVWRLPNQRYADQNVTEHDRYGGGSVMVWGGISMQGRTDLTVLQNRTMTAVIYRDEILDPIVRPYAGAIGPNFLLMDDNARPHRAGIINQYLQQETIERMDWPARSPDLNPIEHAWDMLGVAVRARQVPPRNLMEMGDALQEEWRRIPQQRIRNVISSMRRRCQAVIDVRGAHTRY